MKYRDGAVSVLWGEPGYFFELERAFFRPGRPVQTNTRGPVFFGIGGLLSRKKKRYFFALGGPEDAISVFF